MARLWLFVPQFALVAVLLLAAFAQTDDRDGHLAVDHYRVLAKRQVIEAASSGNGNGTTDGPGLSHQTSTTGVTFPDHSGLSVEQSSMATTSDGMLSTEGSSDQMENTTLLGKQSISANSSLATSMQDTSVNGTESTVSNKSQPSQAKGKASTSVSNWSDNSSSTRRGNTKVQLTSLMPATWFDPLTCIVAIILGLLVLAILCCCIRCCCRGKDSDKDVNDQESWRRIERPLTLFATMPLLDTYLTDRNALESGAVRKNNLGAPFYYLPPQTTLVKCRTGQLYHPPSGLLFSPINGYLFDQNGSSLVNQSDHSQVAANANLVYHQPTKRVYERSLGMCCKADSSWALANSPTGDGTEQMEPIRRARPDELPTKLHGPCSDLLNRWQNNLLQREQAHLAQDNRQPVAQPASVVVVLNAANDHTPPSPRRHSGSGSNRHHTQVPFHYRRRPLMPEDMSDYEDAVSKVIQL